MLKILGVLVLGVVAVILFRGGHQTSHGAGTPRPGSNLVYQRIAAETDCSELQRTFDVADRDGGITGASYMDAADRRMRTLGCYR